jgi:hypothetical protein
MPNSTPMTTILSVMTKKKKKKNEIHFFLNMSKVVIGYWNVRGLGAQLRYMLKHCDAEFEEELFNQTFDDNAEGYER